MSLLPGRFMGESLPSMDHSFSSLFCVVVTWLLRDDHVIGVNHWSAPEKAKRWRRKKRVKWVHENLVVLWLILVGSRGRSPSVNHLPQWSDIRWIGYSLQAGKIQTLPPTKLTQSQVKVRRRFLFFPFFCDHYVTELQALFLYLSVLVEGNMIYTPFLLSIEIGK